MNDRTNITPLQTQKTDADKAKEYRDRLATMLNPICELLAEAKREGIIISFQLTPPDALGRTHIAQLTTVKEL